MTPSLNRQGGQHLKKIITPKKYLRFAKNTGCQIFGADALYRRVGCHIPKWHTRVQKSGKSPHPGVPPHKQTPLQVKNDSFLMHSSQIASPLWSQAGFVRATLGTMGFVRARASPVRAPGGIRTGSSGQSGLARPGPTCSLHESRPGPVRAGPGTAHGNLPHAYPVRTPGGICMGACGLERAARTGPAQIHVQARSNPARIPHGPPTGSLSGILQCLDRWS